MPKIFIIISVGLAIGAVSFLGWVVFRKNRRSITNRTFFYFTIVSVFWNIFNFLIYQVQSPLLSFWFIRLSMFFAVWYSFMFFQLFHIFPKPKFTFSNTFKFIKILAVFTSLLTLTPLVLAEITELTPSGQIATIRNGPAIPLFGIVVIVFIIGAIRELVIKIKHSEKIGRLQLSYVLAGTSITFLLHIIFNFIFPALINNPNYVQLGSLFTFPFILFTSYSIIRYRLLDIRLVISRSLLYLILVSFVTALFTFLTYFTATVFNDVLGANAIFTTFVVSLLLVLTLEPLKKYIGKNTDKIFFKARIDYQNVLRMISELISLEIDLNSLTYSVSKILKEELKLAKAILFLPNKTGGGFTAVADSTLVGTRVTANHPLLPYLKKYRDLIVTEEMEREIADQQEGTEKKRKQLILTELQELEVSLCIPCFVEGEMKSILMLGKKLSGEIFSKDDFDLLEVFAPQLGTALEKAKLYKEVKDFNIKLREEVKRATNNLRLTNIQLEERNSFLQTLQNITNLITRTLDLKKVTQNIVDGISKELGYVGGILLLIDREKDQVFVEAYTETALTKKAVKLLPKPVKEFVDSWSKGTSLAIKAAKTGQRQISSSFADFISPTVPRKFANLIQKLLGIKTVIAVPIFSENQVVGVIIFGIAKDESQISETDFNMMQSLADQAGIVFKNLELYEQIQHTNEKLKVANAHLKDLDEAKSEFMSIASHQLRTPLSGIMGYLSMMLEGDFGQLPKEQNKVVQDVFGASQRLIRMVNLFLNITRIEAGRFKLNLEKVDLVQVIQDQIKTLRPTVAKKNLKLEFKTPTEKIPLLNVDQDKIKDVVLNLVDNAIKYTEKGGITVSIEKRDNAVLTSVKDTGVGIKPEEAEKLFAKFVRGSGISRLSPDGSGLGLFIARKIVDAHGGKIWAESKGEGKGSAFRFELPVK